MSKKGTYRSTVFRLPPTRMFTVKMACYTRLNARHGLRPIIHQWKVSEILKALDADGVKGMLKKKLRIAALTGTGMRGAIVGVCAACHHVKLQKTFFGKAVSFHDLGHIDDLVAEG